MPKPWALLSQGAEPTVAHWLEGVVEQSSETLISLNPERPTAVAAATVIVVRTIPHCWLKPLRALRQRGLQVVLLLDDDLLTPEALVGLPWRYRWRLWRDMTRHRWHLHRWFTELWVSSEPLKRQCELITDLPIHILPLVPSALVLKPPRMSRIAYLGTASHHQELAWLVELFHQLQRRRNDCLLELVVDRRWRRAFAGIPRLRMLYPMDWQTFGLDTGNRQIDLLLVPLLPGSFNAGRSPVKVFDARRLGAAGLYSKRHPYLGCVRNGVDGLLLGDDPQEWLQAVDFLLDDTSAREALVAASCQRTDWSNL